MSELKHLVLNLCFFLFSANIFAQGIEIYPHPHQVALGKDELIVNSSFKIKGTNLSDAHTLQLLDSIFTGVNDKKEIPFTIKKLPKNVENLQRSGAYRLTVDLKGITVEAFDKRSAFYAVQTLSQLVKNDWSGKISLPTGIITDYPDVAFRGTVEGFYGEPWSHQDRLEQLRFYGKFKLNTYIYGPKDDPYHSSPHWRDAYPEQEASQIKDLIEEAHKNYVNFVWAIHPGKDIKWNRADSNAVIQKFEKMYQLGVRSFAVFFDDISGTGTDAKKQADLLNFIKKEFTDKKEDVMPLIMCPTEYNKSWANKESGTYLDILGDQLDPSIHVMWTGNSVISDNTLEGLEWVNARIKRPAYVWWNFPVSDYVRNHLLMGPAYGLDKNAAHAMSGFVSNPMDKAEASKIAIFGIADYSWNLADYDPIVTWRKANYLLMPEAPEAFLTFNSHNSDLGANGHGYRRDESVEIKPIMESFLAAYKKGAYQVDSARVIKEEFIKIKNAPGEILLKSKNKRLIEQISPWLQHFEFLGKAGEQTMDMIANIRLENKAAGWKDFVHLESLLDSMAYIDRTYNQNPYQPGIVTGSLVLAPFIKEVIEINTPYFADSLASQSSSVGNKTLLAKLKKSKILSNASVFINQPLIIRNDYVAFSPKLEVVDLLKDEFFGLELTGELKIIDFEVNLENNDLNEWGIFEASKDGENWKPLKVNTVNGKGSMTVSDPEIKSIRFRNTSENEHSIYLKAFKLVSAER